MAKVIDNIITEGLSGKVQGDKMYIFRQMYNKTFFQKAGTRTKEWTQAQILQQTKFKTALQNALTRLKDTTQQVADRKAFKEQKKCKTMLGFLVKLELLKIKNTGN